MKCLTVHQPWAALLMLGARLDHVRDWMPAFRGRLAVHAARRFAPEDQLLCEREPIRSILRQAGLSRLDLPRGAILGTAHLSEVIPRAVFERERLPLFEPAAVPGDGQYVWHFTDPVRLPRPVPWRGQLGLFQVRAALLDVAEVA